MDLKTNVSGCLQTFWIGTLIGVLQVGAIGPRLGTVDLKTNVSGCLQTFWIGTLIGVLQVGFSAIHRWKKK